MEQPLRVLIVADKPDVAELVIRALQQSGLDPTWERVGMADELRAALANGPWDAVLTDHSLPAFGVEASLEVVRDSDPDLPFIVVSGTVGEDAAVAMMRAGASDYTLQGPLARLIPVIEREIRESGNRRVKRAAERVAMQLASVVQSSDDAISSMTPDGNIISWNPAAERLHGWTAAEAIGRHISFIVPPDKADELVELMQRLQQGNLLKHYETVRLHRDGTRREVSITASPIRDLDGNLVGISKFARDIGQMKRAETELQASETRYRRLFEAAQDGILIVDVTTRHILDANPFLTNLLCCERSELMGKELWEIGLFQDIEANKAAFRALQEKGYIRYENRPLATKDGRAIEVEFVSNIYVVGDAEVIQCNIREITERRRSEAALRTSEERYRTLISATSAIVWDSPASGAFDTDQPAWTLFTGQTVEQHRGWGWLDAVHKDDREKSAEAWAAAVAQRTVYQVVHRLRRADGQFRLMNVRAVPIFKPDGEIREWVGVHSDVTEQSRIESERAELLAQLKLQIERMPLAYLLSGPDGRYTRWNPAAERMFGFTEAEVLGQLPSQTIVPPQSEAKVAEVFARLAAGDMNAHGMCENQTKTGQIIECEWHNTPLFGPGGDFQGILSLAQDVTSRRQGEKTLQLRDRAIQAATQGLVITDSSQADNPIIYVSPGFERITGYLSEEVVGRNCRFLQGVDTAPATIAQMRDAIRAEVPCSVELLNYRKDGTSFWNELSVAPVRNADGQLTHFVGVQADVTARRSLQEQFRQAQKMEAFGQLAGGVAHDFNNLLTIIIGYSDLLLQTLSAEDPSRDRIAEIHKAGERSAELTRQLLAFSRQQILAPRVFNLNEVMTETEKMLRRLIGEDIQLSLEMDCDLWDIRADPGQIEQVLLNLSVNARDAMPKGGRLSIQTQNVELDGTYVHAHADALGGPHVLLSVTDTGSGMSPEVQERIFEPFFTTKGVGKGTGLGLATVFGIVKQSGGHIAVDSEIGVGTSFKVYLPKVERQADGLKSPSPILVPPRGTETVLLTEDEAGVRNLTSQILAGCGYKVLEAADGDEAVRKADKHDGPIHLLITDVVMPGPGGQAVSEQVAQRHPEICVLFISGYTDDDVIRRGVLREDVNFLQKPFSAFALACKVREILDGK